MWVGSLRGRKQAELEGQGKWLVVRPVKDKWERGLRVGRERLRLRCSSDTERQGETKIE